MPHAPPTDGPSGRRTAITLAAAALLLLGASGIAGTAWWIKRSGRRHAVETASRAHDAFVAGRHGEAFSLFAAAAAEAPLDPGFQKSAARAALAADRRPEAVTYAKRAWEMGLRDEEVLTLLLLDVGQGDRAAVLKRGEELIGELPEGAQRLRMRGRLLAEFGEDERALEAFRTALERDPDATTVSDYAELLARRQEIDRLYTDLQGWRSRGLLDASGYRLLALSAAYRRQERGTAAADDPLDLIAEAIARQRVDARLRVDQALHLCDHLRFADALAVAKAVDDPAQRRDAGLIVIWCLIDSGDIARLRDLAEAPPGPGPQGEGLTLVMKAMTSPDRSVQERLLDLARAERLLGAHAILRLFTARMHAQANEPDLALRLYQSITGLLAATPTVLVEEAAMLATLGRHDAALAMVLDLHRLHGASKRSLMLLGQLAGESGDPSLMETVRTALAAAPAGDHELVALAAQLGTSRHDPVRQIGGAALAGLDETQRAAVASVRRLLGEGQPAQALAAADQSRTPAPVREAWRGLALHALERHEEALQALAAARGEDQPALLDLTAAASALLVHHPETAASAARAALAKVPGDADGNRLLALAQLDGGDAAGALATIAAAGDLPGLAAVRAMALAQLGRHDDALAVCLATLRRAPEDLVALSLAADLAGPADQAGTVLPLLVAALRARADDQALLRRLATTALACGDAPRARAALDRLVELRPRDGEVALQRARVLALSGELRAAQLAIDLLPSSVPPVQRALASSLLQRCSGRPAAAIHLLEPLLAEPAAAEQWALLVIESDRERPVAAAFAGLRLEPVRWLRIAYAAERAGRWADAAELMSLARAQHGDDTALLNNWAWYALHVPGSDREAVIAAARTAWSRAPTDPALTDTWCEVLLAAGRGDDCLSALAGLGERALADPQLLLHRGRALALRGEKAAAITAFHRAIELAAAISPWPLREDRPAIERRIAGLEP
jgi:tetratricopeptide (TPR) repeat protein